MLGVDASQNLLRMSMTAMDECNERRAEAEECSILPFDRLVDVLFIFDMFLNFVRPLW